MSFSFIRPYRMRACFYAASTAPVGIRCTDIVLLHTTIRTPQNESLLLLAVKHKLEVVADHLCEVLGSDLSSLDRQGNSPLWVALRSRQETIASKLVRIGLYGVLSGLARLEQGNLHTRLFFGDGERCCWGAMELL